MSEARRSTQTQLADLNVQISRQNDQLKNITRVANETENTQNGIQN